jgi:DinB superfamily
MAHNLQHTISVLSRTPAALNALLRDLPEEWTMQNEGKNTWRVFDVVGHLIHGERTDWMVRVKTILELGEARTFEPFDRQAQDRESRGKSLGQLLDEFAQLRSENLEELRTLNLQQEALALRGKHPALGNGYSLRTAGDMGHP